MHTNKLEKSIELSVVLPCLNEADTLEGCINSIFDVLKTLDVSSEIVVADNGSTDGSAEIARKMGVVVISESVRGYGSAIKAGVSAARGKYIVMADADGSYSFAHIPKFLKKMEEGYELVMGNRFKGKIEHGAMPLSHAIGGTILSMIGKVMFHVPVADFHCGIRAFTKDAFEKMDLETDGMEFASEMIIKAKMHGLTITEIPTILYKDGRIQHPPHLRTWQDGWRHLRLMLLFAPKMLLLYPGIAVFAAGLLSTLYIGASAPLLLKCIPLYFALLGMEMVLLSQEPLYAANGGRINAWKRIFRKSFTFEKTILLGLFSLVVGISLYVSQRDSLHGIEMIAAAVLAVAGIQTMLLGIVANIYSVQKNGL